VVKLVDAGDSKSPAARRAGSIPAPGTTQRAAHVQYGAAFLFSLQKQAFAVRAHITHRRPIACPSCGRRGSMELSVS
jgi:hypothetical protein